MRVERKIDTHFHTEYSNLKMLDSTNKLEFAIDSCVELGNAGVAITDHECLSGHIKAMQYVKDGKRDGLIPEDFKLILGNEIYLIDEVSVNENGSPYSKTPYYHFILLAKDEIGHEQLRELSTRAWARSFTSGVLRTPTLKSDLEEVIGNNKGHLVAQSACLGSEIGKLLIEEMLGESDVDEIKEKIDEFLKFCLSIFGDDFYLEMQPSSNPEQIYANKRIIELSEEYEIETVITCDVHYMNKDLSPVHEAYLNSREDSDRELASFYETTYLMSCEEIHQWLDDVIGEKEVSRALSNTLLIGDKVKEYDLYHTEIVPKPTLPTFELGHYFENAYEHCEYIKKFAYSDNKYDNYFLYLIEEGWYDKEYDEDMDGETFKEMMIRINLELEAIWETSIKIKDNVASYYLTALEIIELMWEEGNSLVGCSRGSIASFYTAYLIDLQQVNPMKYNIPYWRHLHASRPEMPKTLGNNYELC